MRAILWILQSALGATFLAIGATKVFQDTDDLIAAMPEVADFPGWLIITIGLVEIAGALGLVLPAATRIAPVLTPLAAIGLSLTMAAAAAFHVARAEYADIAVNLTLLLPLVVVAAARLSRWSIETRTRSDRSAGSPG